MNSWVSNRNITLILICPSYNEKDKHLSFEWRISRSYYYYYYTNTWLKNIARCHWCVTMAGYIFMWSSFCSLDLRIKTATYMYTARISPSVKWLAKHADNGFLACFTSWQVWHSQMKANNFQRCNVSSAAHCGILCEK